MKHGISVRWLANPNQGCRHFPHYFWSSYEYLVHSQCEDLKLIKWSCTSPPIMWTFEPRLINIFWAHSPISFEHMSFWVFFGKIITSLVLQSTQLGDFLMLV